MTNCSSKKYLREHTSGAGWVVPSKSFFQGQFNSRLHIVSCLKKWSYSISKSKLTLSASPCRIIDTVCGSPSRHF
ncbi:hypothetical protein SAMN05421863_10164 [Nitrosomonas communis]|uniref:Uncharacterized protein n=1 Tax=Nitrosomonas communis TaxID=44574 RepID=A0A1I4NQB8_9PROT|nr:hypothetical protein SAMN05421863_10164 [Nitrosomonas communis]